MHFYKHCMCRTEWCERDRFIDDPEVAILGYQAGLSDPAKGFFLFNHLRQDPQPCHSTLALPVTDFMDLYTGPRYMESRKGLQECLGLCMKTVGTERCTAPCRNAWAREILYHLYERHRAVAADASAPR